MSEDLDEQRRLVGSEAAESIAKAPEKTATVPVAVMSILNSIIGVGVMTLPYSLKINGYLLGFFLFLLCAWLAHLAFLYLSNASAQFDSYGYREMSEKIFTKKYVSLIISVIMIVYVSGSMSSYCIALMDNMYWWQGDENKAYRLLLCSALMLLVIFPLSCLDNLEFMKFNSYLTVFCIMVVAVSVSAFFFIYKPDEPKE